MTWTLPTAGLELCVTSTGWSQTLSSMELTLLDNYSWQSIVNIGKTFVPSRKCEKLYISGRICLSLTKFHLTLWREDMTDVSSLDLPDNWKLNPLFLNVKVSTF